MNLQERFHEAVMKIAMPPMAVLKGARPLPGPARLPNISPVNMDTTAMKAKFHMSPTAVSGAATVRPGQLKSAVANPGMLRRLGQHLVNNEDAHEIAGLGTLAIPGIDHFQAKGRAMLAGDKSPNASSKRRLMSEDAHEATEIGGLGYLAAPLVAKKLLGMKGHA